MAAPKSIKDYFRPSPTKKVATQHPSAETSKVHSRSDELVSTSSPTPTPTPNTATLLTINTSPHKPKIAGAAGAAGLEPPSSSAVSSVSIGGKAVIKSSDSEDSESDSDDSLIDINVLLHSHRPPQLSQGQTSSQALGQNGPSGDVSKTGIARFFRASSPPKKKTAQASLQAMIEQVRKEREEDERGRLMDEQLAAAHAEMQRLENDGQEVPSGGGSGKQVADQTDLLTSVIADKDEDEVQTVLRAIKRTEATHTHTRWHFFDFSARVSTAEFPLESIGSEWKAVLENPASRNVTFTSGFMMDVARMEHHELPDSLFRWMLDEICIEERDDLRQAYQKTVACLEASILKVITPAVLSGTFQRLGGSASAIDLQTAVEHNGEPQAYGSHNWDMLTTFVELLGDVSEGLSQESRICAICFLARLCIDAMVMSQITLLRAVQKSFSSLCLSFSDKEWVQYNKEVCTKIFAFTKSACLQVQMLRSLPAVNPRVHNLRQRLALAFFFKDSYYADKSPESTLDLSKMIRELQRPRFRITESTDYYALAAQISLLDMAVDDGRNSTVDRDGDHAEEDEFNELIDQLEVRIKVIWSSINDQGASFISRLEAKETIETVRHRMAFVVRTRPKPKHSIFEKTIEEEKLRGRQAAFMKGYLVNEA